MCRGMETAQKEVPLVEEKEHMPGMRAGQGVY